MNSDSTDLRLSWMSVCSFVVQQLNPAASLHTQVISRKALSHLRTVFWATEREGGGVMVSPDSLEMGWGGGVGVGVGVEIGLGKENSMEKKKVKKTEPLLEGNE